MRIFASLDTAISPEKTHTLVGRNVANAAFLEALWKHADFDEYHFFPGDQAERSAFLAWQQPRWEAAGLKGRVILHPRFELMARLANTNYHVFHQSDFVTYFGALCRIRSRYAKQRFPVTALTHSLSYSNYQSVYLQLLLTKPSAYDSIICTSNSGRTAVATGLELLAGAGEVEPLGLKPRFRLDLIPLGVDLDRFTPPSPEQRLSARNSLGLPSDVPVILCLGRFSAADKYDLVPLVRAFRIFEHSASTLQKVKLRRAILVLAGARQGSDYPEQVLAIARATGLEGRVHLHTDVSGKQQIQLYHAADIFVSPSDSLQETFGLTVVEAMACGLPVVASAWNGYKELVEDGTTGFLVKTYVDEWDGPFGELGTFSYQRPWHLAVAQATVVDVPDMANALRKLVLQPELCRIMGAAGAKRARAYSWKSVIRRYLALWDELKAEAMRDTSPAPPPSPFAFSPLQLFPEHASARLPQNGVLMVTDRGMMVLSTASQRQWYRDLDPLMDPTAIRHLCAMARQNYSVAAAVTLVSDAQGHSAAAIRYKLCWAIKNDLIRIKP